MRVAALDLGTNTFLCLIVDGDAGGIHKVIRDEVEIVRLGQGVDATGEFHPDALDRARKALAKFRKLIDETGGVDKVMATATSAARDVSNGAQLFQMGDEFSIPMSVISGDEEAQLSYAGACSDVNDSKKRLIIDIGGGSTELILGAGKKLLFSKSVDLGAVRLTERLVPAQPVPADQQTKLMTAIDENLRSVMTVLSKDPIEEVLAVAGTPSAIAAAELGGFDPVKVDGYFISREKLKGWVDQFGSTDIEYKKKTFGLGGRADIIFAGTSILWRVLESLQQPGFRVSIKGLRYGLALRLLSGS